MDPEQGDREGGVPPVVGVALMVVITVVLAATLSTPLTLPENPVYIDYEGYQNGSADLHINNTGVGDVAVLVNGERVRTVEASRTTVRVDGLQQGDRIRVLRTRDDVFLDYVYFADGTACHDAFLGHCIIPD